jgi:hypothetical protein
VLATLSRDDTLFHAAKLNIIVSGEGDADVKGRQELRSHRSAAHRIWKVSMRSRPGVQDRPPIVLFTGCRDYFRCGDRYRCGLTGTFEDRIERSPAELLLARGIRVISWEGKQAVLCDLYPTAQAVSRKLQENPTATEMRRMVEAG